MILRKHPTWKMMTFCLIIELFLTQLVCVARSDFCGIGRLFRRIMNGRNSTSTRGHSTNHLPASSNDVHEQRTNGVTQQETSTRGHSTNHLPASSNDVHEQRTNGVTQRENSINQDHTLRRLPRVQYTMLLPNGQRIRSETELATFLRNPVSYEQPFDEETRQLLIHIMELQLLPYLYRLQAQIDSYMERIENSQPNSVDSESKPEVDGYFTKMKAFVKCVTALCNKLVSTNLKTGINTSMTSENNADNKQIDCPICLSDMLMSDKIVCTECGHVFCKSCIEKAIKTSKIHHRSSDTEVSCPICRNPVGKLRELRLPLVEYQLQKRIRILPEAVRECKRIQKDITNKEEREEKMRYKKYKIRCSQCLHDFAESSQEHPSCLKCGHIVCANCFQHYVAEKKKCPICRKHADSEYTRTIKLPEISVE